MNFILELCVDKYKYIVAGLLKNRICLFSPPLNRLVFHTSILPVNIPYLSTFITKFGELIIIALLSLCWIKACLNKSQLYCRCKSIDDRPALLDQMAFKTKDDNSYRFKFFIRSRYASEFLLLNAL